MCKILVIDDEKVIVSILQEDICMPGVDGNSVAKHIRSSDKKHMPVIGMSGTPWVFENYSFDTILEKPFRLKALIDSVEEFLPIHTKAVAFG
jgi:CheY-like chemotaxis protein